mmetsp:Transcript_25418/g.37477  ORF Transcript_25418/g.37477 Transcript_25418/m.37477 type:complete len:353 (-) Transcript_25418:84-1142(-)
MDALTYFNQLVDNFKRERELQRSYSKMVSPDHSAIHSLRWSERDRAEEEEAMRGDMMRLEEQIQQLRHDYQIKQQEITNAKVSQSMRRSQIARLNGLSQPIELDHTYFFVDRYPSSNSQLSASSLEKTHPTLSSTKMGHMRTGEAAMLEGRLADVSKLAEGHLHAFSSKISSVSTSSETVLSSVEGTNLKREAELLVKDLDNSEQKLYATIFEILNLRLRMIIAQRQEVEEREALAAEKIKYEREEVAIRKKLDKDMTRIKSQFETDLLARMKQYERQVAMSASKLESLEKNNPEEVVTMKEGALRKKVERAKSRYEQLRRRHALEIEGYGNEAQALRKHLQHVTRLIKNSR